MRICKQLLMQLLIGISATVPVSAESEWGASLHWSSRYVSEGRDFVPGRQVAIGTFSAQWERMTLDMEWIDSIGGSFDYYTLGVQYGIDFADFHLIEMRLSTGVRRRAFPSVNVSETWEVFFMTDWGLPGGLDFSANVRYDVDALRGGFVELGLSRPFVVRGSRERLKILPEILLGIDYGLVADHRRFRENHAQIKLGARWILSRRMTLAGGMNQSFPLGVLDKDPASLPLTWGNLGMIIHY